MPMNFPTLGGLNPQGPMQGGTPQGIPAMPAGAPQGMPTGMPVPQRGDDLSRPITEEEKQVLLDLIAKIRTQLGSSDANMSASGNKSEVVRQKLLKTIFDQLQMAGVDLSSRESVASFIMRLQEQNPEIAQMFENSMNILLGSGALTAGEIMPPGGIPSGNEQFGNMPPQGLPQEQEQTIG